MIVPKRSHLIGSRRRLTVLAPKTITCNCFCPLFSPAVPDRRRLTVWGRNALQNSALPVFFSLPAVQSISNSGPSSGGTPAHPFKQRGNLADRRINSRLELLGGSRRSGTRSLKKNRKIAFLVGSRSSLGRDLLARPVSPSNTNGLAPPRND